VALDRLLDLFAHRFYVLVLLVLSVLAIPACSRLRWSAHNKIVLINILIDRSCGRPFGSLSYEKFVTFYCYCIFVAKQTSYLLLLSPVTPGKLPREEAQVILYIVLLRRQ